MTPLKTAYDSEVVRLADLVLAKDIIEGVNFTNCLILGPGVVLVLDDCTFDGNSMPAGTDAIFWIIEATRQSVIGAIPVRNTTFRGCRFDRMGFAGHEELRSSFVLDMEIK